MTKGGAGALRRLPILILAVLGAVLFAAQQARAATVNVSTTSELQNAVASAAGGDTIVLAAATYAPDTTLELKNDVTLVGADSAARGAVIAGQNISAPDGGAPDIIDIRAGASVTLKYLSIRLADRAGTPIDVAGTLTLDSSELSQNNSNAALVAEQGGRVTVRNSTISDNTGIGVDVFGDAMLTNATIAHNLGGGIYDEDGTTSIVNTIVAGNGNGTKGSGDCLSAVTTSVNSLDGDGACGANVHSDPRLGPLAWNGGPTMTRSLQSGSPAIGAGSNCPGIDQRLAPRSSCDIGAYAFGSASPATSVPIPVGSGGSGGSGSPSGGGGTTPSPGSNAGGGSNGTPSTPAPVKPVTPSGSAGKSKVVRQRLVAHGSLRTSSGIASFRLQAVAGAATASFTYDDAAARIHLRGIRITRFVVSPSTRTATLGGIAVDRRAGRRVRLTIVVGASGQRTFRISLPGYRRHGRVSGSVSLAV